MTTRTALRRRHLALLALACVALAAADGALHLLAAQVTPFGGRPTTPPPQEAGGIIGWILAKQAEFYRAMSSTIRAAKTDGSAFWTLMGISFAYGVFHAAGPGHGKAVISSYLVANEETARRGIVLSFVSAMLQALVAVLIVGIGAWLLGATARTLCSTERDHRDRQLWADRRCSAPGWCSPRGAASSSHCRCRCPALRRRWRTAGAPAHDHGGSRTRPCASSRHAHDHDHGHDHAHAHAHGAHNPAARPSGSCPRRALRPQPRADAERTRRARRLDAGLERDLCGGPAPVLRRDPGAGVRAGAGAVSMPASPRPS